MVINQLYAKYFQKSKLFLYPLLGIERGLTAPEEVYCSWEGKYAPEGQKLIVVYSNASNPDFQALKGTKLSKHKLLLEIIPTMQDQEIYVFDFSSYATDWDHLIAGRYSKMSLKTKQTILDYFERYSGNYIYMHSFLFPNKWFKRYAEILDVPEELLIQVGELCDKPDWKKGFSPSMTSFSNIRTLNRKPLNTFRYLLAIVATIKASFLSTAIFPTACASNATGEKRRRKKGL